MAAGHKLQDIAQNNVTATRTDGDNSSKTLVLKVLATDATDNTNGQVARIDEESRRNLGLHFESIIEIKGKMRAVAECRPMLWNSDEGKGIIRMSSTLRRNAGVTIGDSVVISKAECNYVRAVTMSPFQEIPEDERSFRISTDGIPITVGNEVTIAGFGAKLVFKLERIILDENFTALKPQKIMLVAWHPSFDDQDTEKRIFNAWLKAKIRIRQQGRCACCGELLADYNTEYDHNIPYAFGGPTAEWNGQAVCTDCHKIKTGYQNRQAQY